MKTKTFIAALLLSAAALFTVSCEKDTPTTSSDPVTPEEPTGSPFGLALRSLDIVSRVDTIIPQENPSEYKELYKVTFTQPLDHNNPSAGTFTQKAFLFYVGSDRPTVLYTRGYFLNDRFRQTPFVDLAHNMNANLLMVEHRYFGESKPANPTEWTYLTISQAAADLHDIIQALKPLLPKEWVSTGTSKDGMTSIFLRYFYPDDIAVSTAFCSPFYASLNFLPVGSYLNEESGTPEERSQMRALMERLLQNGENGMYARFAELVEQDNLIDHSIDRNFTWSVNYCLDYFFNFFSYLTPSTRQLPSLDTPTDQLLEEVFSDLFEHKDLSIIYPYCIQAAKELGSPIMDFEYYSSLLQGTAFDINQYRQDPCELEPVDRWIYATYDSTMLADILNNFFPNTTCPLLLVYAKDDPWTAARPSRINGQYSKVIVNPLGVHNHDINNPEHFSPETKQEIMDFIARYVSFNNDPVVAKRAPFVYYQEMDDKFMIGK